MARWWQPLFTTRPWVLSSAANAIHWIHRWRALRRVSCRFTHPIISGPDNVRLNLRRVRSLPYRTSRERKREKKREFLRYEPRWLPADFIDFPRSSETTTSSATDHKQYIIDVIYRPVSAIFAVTRVIDADTLSRQRCFVRLDASR